MWNMVFILEKLLRRFIELFTLRAILLIIGIKLGKISILVTIVATVVTFILLLYIYPENW